MNNKLKEIWKVLDQPEKKKFRFLAVVDILVSIADIFSLGILLWTVQFYIQPAGKLTPTFLPIWLADRHSLAIIAIFVLVFSTKNLIAFLVSRARYAFLGKVAIRLSQVKLNNYQRSDFAEFIDIDSSVHIRKIAFQPFEFSQYMLSGIQELITQVSLIILTIIAILLFNTTLFLLLLCVLLPPVVIVFYFMKSRLEIAKRKIRDSNEKSFQHLLDSLKGYVEGNIYNRNDFFAKRFIQQRENFSKYLFQSMSLQTLPPRIIEIFAVLGLFVLIAIAKWSADNTNATFVTIGAFMAAAYKIIPGIVKIINALGQIDAYGYSIDDLKSNKPLNNNRRENGLVVPVKSIQLNNVGFSYNKQAILSQLCFTINTGDFVAITGVSGKGKTTILNILLGFLSPQKGNVLINGKIMTDQNMELYWPQIAYVRQQTFFIHDTVLRNITLEENNFNQEHLDEALKISGLTALISTYPEGLNKLITENGKNISGGQQQRIAIARAVYKNAGIILLDEPFNELDEVSVVEMLNHFKTLSSEGKIIMLITHDQKNHAWCNKIVRLNDN